MKTSIRQLLFALVSSAMLSLPVWADGVGICDNCSQIQMQEAATGVYSDNSIVHMLDFGQGLYRSYFVEIISEPGISRTIVQQIDTPQDVAGLLQNTLDLASFLSQDKDVNVGQLPLGNHPIGSAIDLGANPTAAGGLVHAVELWLADSGTNGGIVVSTNILHSLTGLGTNSIITVHFPDGTTARIQITNITVDEQGNPVLTGQLVGLYDEDNWPVPTSSSGVNGFSRDFADQAEMDRWTNLMRRLGIPIEEGTTPAQGGGNTPPTPVRMECWVEPNGTPHCRFIYE